MIIRTSDSSLVLITQPDHAALAGRLMRCWEADGFPQSPRRADILTAVDLHDNGWHEVDASPIVDAATGKLLDFVSVPYDVRTGVWPRGVERLRETPYAAALVAHHAVYVYDRCRADPQWAPFFEQMQAICDHHLAASGVSREDLLHDYRFLRLGDLLSLTFCNAWPEPQADAFGYRIRFDGARLSVLPDPFGGRPIPLEIPARRLPNRRYESSEDAAKAWQAAATMEVGGVAAGMASAAAPSPRT
jgi:Protein of unknown function (DUF3891)